MKETKTFWTILSIFFVVYISIFMASKSGYYEYENRNRKEFTEKKMKEFEEDVRNGKNVDLKNYFKENDVNYENKITIVGNKMSQIVTSGINKGLEGSFKVLEKLFY